MIRGRTPKSNQLPVTLWLFISALLLATPLHVQANHNQQVFVLHSYTQEYPWTASQHEGFTSVYSAAKKDKTDLRTEYLDTKRNDFTTEYANWFTNYLAEKYEGYHPDIIYTTDDDALSFALEHLDRIFPQTPVIFSGINNYKILDKLDVSKVTGVFEKKEITPNLALIEFIDTGIRNLAIVGDNSNTFKSIEIDTREQLDRHPEIQADFISHGDMSSLTQALASRKDKFILLSTLGSIKSHSGETLTLNEILSGIVNAGDFTIISMEDAYMADGILGGFVTSGRKQGEAAARMLIDYLDGTPIEKIPPLKKSPNEYHFNYSQLEKTGITLPNHILANASIYNKPQTFYQRNRTLVLGSIYILAALLFASMSVFIFLFRRKNQEIQKTSFKLQKQADSLTQISNSLATYQQISLVGNWDWNITTGENFWSNEIYQMLGIDHHDEAPGLEKYLEFVPVDQRKVVEDAINGTIETQEPAEIETKIIHRDQATSYIKLITSFREIQNDEKVLAITLLDISTLKKNELLESEKLDRVERYQDALLEWSKIDYKNLDEAFERATEISSKTLHVKRVSIWLYNKDMSEIVCKDLYIQGEGHIKGLELYQKDFPHYFDALQSGKIITADEARTDERTREFAEHYLAPNDIYSMLDVPILYQGGIAGVVCHEETGSTRLWSTYEQEFASAIANSISLSLEIDKRKQIEKQLAHQAYHDSLTGLPNRTLFIDRLEQSLRQAKRNGTLLAVLFIDLDNFKQINDSLGHAIGDQVLVNVAKRLKNKLRNVDTISRLGGDEFTIILSSFEDIESINEVAVKLFNVMQEPMIIDDNEFYITSSIGVSVYPNDGETVESLLRNADAAMYRAKEDGRNRFEFYTEDMTERAFEKVLMINNLRKAIDNDEFYVCYQPQYLASSGSLIGMEALIRWRHPDFGIISPAHFIPAAEESGLVVPLDRLVMKKVFKQTREWFDQGLNPGRVSLNLAVKQLEQEDFIEILEDELNTSGCKPEWISFEVTEGQVMNDPEKSISTLNKISQFGIEIAVDDFGTGHSSLMYLKRLPVDKLKIDRSFIRDIPEDDEDTAITRAIIALATSMKLKVIAEGVETQKQVDFLANEGCPEIQGYYYHPPLESGDMQELLEKAETLI